MRHVALVIDQDVAARCHAVQMFAAIGWSAIGSGFDGWAAAGRSAPPDLILVDVDGGHGQTEARLSAIRAAPIGQAPLVAWTDLPPPDLIALGYDDVFPRSRMPVRVDSLAGRWRPYAAPAAFERLGVMLGAADVDAVAAGLHRQLAALLERPAGPDVQGEAHRIAGIAGMLGFAELGASWLAVSHGEAGAWPAARVAARRALVTLARRPSAPAPQSTGG